MHIGIDMDETTVETVQGLLKFYDNKIFGVLLHKEDITNYHMSKLPQLQTKGITDRQINELFNTFIADASDGYIHAIDKVQNNLKKLKEQGAHITTVTARPKQLHNVTIDTLEKYFPGLIDDIIFANHYTANHKSKGLICRESNIDIMVEDNLNYAEDLANKGVPVHIIQQPRNKHYDKSYQTYGIYKHTDRDSIGKAIMGSD